MALKALPPREYILEALDYDPLTGLFTWRERPPHHFASEQYQKRFNKKYAGKHAGNISSRKYLRVRLQEIEYNLHRLAWIIVHGEPLPPEIDHRDRDRLNNKIANLRAATRDQNRVNVGPLKNNVLGVKGVVFRRGKFKARIMINGLRYDLGQFDTLEMAGKAYQDAAIALHGEFARW
jgi:hypothetical protein